jgi:hypothetical protein
VLLTYLPYQLCHCVSFLVTVGNSFWLHVSKKDSYSFSLIERESASKCVYFIRSNTLLLCISLLCIYLLFRTDPQTHRLDCFLKFPELSSQVEISRIPSNNADKKVPIFLINTLLLSQFHKHSFTPYPPLSGQVGISRIPSKNADKKITDLYVKHTFPLSFS